MRNLVNYLGLEEIETVSGPVSPEAEQEADEVLEAARYQDEVDCKEIDESYENKQSAHNEVAALEQFCGILTHGLEQGDFHPQFAAAVNTYSRRFEAAGIPGSEQLSLENYSPKDLKDYYTVSNEFFGKMWQKFKKGLSDRFELAVSNYRELPRDDRRQARARALKVKADALQQRVSKLPSGKIQINLEKEIRVFTSQGVVVKYPDKAVEKDLKSTEFLLKQYVPKLIKWLEGLRAISVQALGAASLSRSGSIGDVKADVEKFFKANPHPGEILTRGLIDGSDFINNDRMVYEPHSRPGTDTADIVDRHANTVPPYMKDYPNKAPKAGTLSLTKTEINALLKAVRQYALLLSRSSEETRGIMKSLQSDVQMYWADGARPPWAGDDEYVVERLLSLLMFSPEFIEYALTGVYTHVGKVTDGIFTIVESALAQATLPEGEE